MQANTHAAFRSSYTEIYSGLIRLAMTAKSFSVGMTNTQCPPLRDAHTALIAQRIGGLIE